MHALAGEDLGACAAPLAFYRARLRVESEGDEIRGQAMLARTIESQGGWFILVFAGRANTGKYGVQKGSKSFVLVSIHH